MLLAAAVNLSVHSLLTGDDVAAYGWRIAFLFGGAIGLLSFWLRRKLEETPAFAEMKHLAAKHPLSELLREHWQPVLLGIGTTAVVAAFNGLLFAHMPAYLDRVLHYDPRRVAIGQNVGLAVVSTGILLSGWLGDKLPRRYVLRVGSLLLMVLSYPFYPRQAAIVSTSCCCSRWRAWPRASPTERSPASSPTCSRRACGSAASR